MRHENPATSSADVAVETVSGPRVVRGFGEPYRRMCSVAGDRQPEQLPGSHPALRAGVPG